MTIGPEKDSGSYGIWTHDLCDTGAALYQLSWQAGALHRNAKIRISYIYNHYSSLGWFIWTQHIDQLPVCLLSSVGRALHRYRKGQGLKSRTGLNCFFRSCCQLLVQLCSWLRGSLKIRFFTAVQIYEFHISKIIKEEWVVSNEVSIAQDAYCSRDVYLH